MSHPTELTAAADEHEPHGHEHAHVAHGHSHDADHGHSHGGVDANLLGSQEAMRTLMLSLVVLGFTAAFQVVIYLFSGSVALLADTVHNVGDALTAVPLGAAFILGRRLPTRTLTYGWGRAEDLAGLAVVLIILFSAIVAGYEAIDRLFNPQPATHLLATAVAGIVGFIGNEWVAVYRIRSGKRIGSAALEADGHHARIDGFTSLAVVAGVIGVALGVPAADPIIGLLISVAIVRIVWTSARQVGLRALDGVEERVTSQIEAAAGAVPGVRSVEDVRARWIGHTIRAELAVRTDPGESLSAAGNLADMVEHALIDATPNLSQAAVRVLPAT